MRTRLAAAGALAIAFSLPSPVRGGGEISVYGIRHEPVGRIGDFVDGSWGGGAEVAWKWSEAIPGLWLGLGGEYVGLHDQQVGSTRTKEDYFRLFGGGRRLFLGDRGLRPFLEAHLSAVRHSISQSTDTGIGAAGTGFLDWGFGYDVGAGLHLNAYERMTGFVAVRWLQSFGLRGDPPNDDIAFDPTYWDVCGGIGWTFGFLDVGGGS